MIKSLTILFWAACCFMANGQTTLSLAFKISALSGSYRHSPPCDECTGIETTLIIDCSGPCNTGSYLLMDASVNSLNMDRQYEKRGKWIISDTAVSANDSTVILALTEADDENKPKDYYELIEGNLTQLNRNKQPIQPPFNTILLKLPSDAVLDIR